RPHRRARVLHSEARAVNATPFTTLDRARATRGGARRLRRPGAAGCRRWRSGRVRAGGRRGRGAIWRREGAREEIVELRTGVCLTVPLGAHFQFRALGDELLTVPRRLPTP